MGLAIPEKQYFKIREAADILDLEPYTLRYWESEFKILKPSRTRTNKRLYHRKDLDILMQIKHLLYDEGFTIAGTKKHLQMMKKQVPNHQETTKTRKNINSNQKSELEVVKAADDAGFQDCIDYRKLLLYIRTELQAVRSTLE